MTYFNRSIILPLFLAVLPTISIFDMNSAVAFPPNNRDGGYFNNLQNNRQNSYGTKPTTEYPSRRREYQNNKTAQFQTRPSDGPGRPSDVPRRPSDGPNYNPRPNNTDSPPTTIIRDQRVQPQNSPQPTNPPNQYKFNLQDNR